MHIESLRHKGLRQLYLDDVTKGVPAHLVDKLRKQLFAMETAASLDQLNHFPAGGCIRSKATLPIAGA